MAKPSTDWRAEVTREERVIVCQHIVRKLAMYYSTTPEDALKQRTSSFESQAYSGANSREDYLRKIAQGLTNFENEKSESENSSPALNMTSLTMALNDIENEKSQSETSSPSLNTTSLTMPEPSMDWHAEVTRQERVIVCQHIVRKLAMYYSTTPEDTLKQRTSSFESQAYSGANSREDYLRKIAQGLSNVERRAIQNHAKQLERRVRQNHGQ